MVKFLHTADWQLGMTRHFLQEGAQARFTQARLDVIGEIGKLAVEESCEFVVVCGDVFESNQVSQQVLMRAFGKMAATPQVMFYLLPGNHDPLDASSIYYSPAFKKHQPKNVQVLESLVKVSNDVELIPAPWKNKHPTSDLVAVACEGLVADNTVRIVVGHGAVDKDHPNPDEPKLIALGHLEELLGDRVVHYVALGDHHSKKKVGDSGRVRYSGAPEPTSYNETNPGHVLIVDLSATNVSVESHYLATWRFTHIKQHLSTDEDLDELKEQLADLENKERTIVKMSIEGELSVAQMARFDELMEHNADLLAALEQWERHSDLIVVPDNTDIDQFGLSGFAHEALLEISEVAKNTKVNERGNDAGRALRLLRRLVEPKS